MKAGTLLLMALCGLLAGNAEASHWVKVLDSKASRIYVDNDRISSTGGIVAAWYRRSYVHPMLTQDNKSYKSAEVLNYYNCPSREIAAAQWITYQKNDGKGKVISNERVSPLIFGDILTGSANETVFNYVCNYVKKH